MSRVSTFRYDAKKLRVFNILSFEVLSKETLVPPKPKPTDERGTKFAAYYALLKLIAEDYAAQTPSEMIDREIEADYMRMRIKIFYKLDLSPARNLPVETEEECARKLELLKQFARTLTPKPDL